MPAEAHRPALTNAQPLARQAAGPDSCLQVGFAGANLDPALTGLGLGEDGASWAVDGIRQRRLHAAGGPASLHSGHVRSQREQDFAVGDKVEGKYRNGCWYPAVVAAEKSDGTFELRWDDGDSQDRIKGPGELRRRDAAAAAAGGGGGLVVVAEQATDWGGAWKVGDVIGLACDLDRGALLVSVNGDFASPNGLAFSVGVQPGSAAGASLYPAFSGRRVRVAYSVGAAAAPRPLRFLAEGYAPVLAETEDAFHLESLAAPPPRASERRAAAEAEAAEAADRLIAARAGADAARKAQVAAVLAEEVPKVAAELRGEFEAMFAKQKALPAETFNNEAEYKALIVEAIDAKVLASTLCE